MGVKFCFVKAEFGRVGGGILSCRGGILSCEGVILCPEGGICLSVGGKTVLQGGILFAIAVFETGMLKR